jgi:hypothetical protein
VPKTEVDSITRFKIESIFGSINVRSMFWNFWVFYIYIFLILQEIRSHIVVCKF